MRRVIVLTVAVLLVIVGMVAYQLSSRGEGTCAHDYYLADYVPATEEENGYREYTCLHCRDTYRETVPMLQMREDVALDAQEGENTRSYNLFTLPVYSMSGRNIVNPVSFEADLLDVEGYHHKNCYQLLCSNSSSDPAYQRWELEGEYSKVDGTIYMREGNPGSFWLEFYDGEELIYTTERLSAESTSVSFSVDVTGVNFLTMYGKSQGSMGCWIIADQITITKNVGETVESREGFENQQRE